MIAVIMSCHWMLLARPWTEPIGVEALDEDVVEVELLIGVVIQSSC
jgi:hypothetical protein